MNATDVVTTPNVEGFIITEYLGVVSHKAASTEKVMSGIVEQATDLRADKVVGFRYDWSASAQRVYGQGTAVKVRASVG